MMPQTRFEFRITLCAIMFIFALTVQSAPPHEKGPLLTKSDPGHVDAASKSSARSNQVQKVLREVFRKIPKYRRTPSGYRPISTEEEIRKQSEQAVAYLIRQTDPARLQKNRKAFQLEIGRELGDR